MGLKCRWWWRVTLPQWIGAHLPRSVQYAVLIHASHLVNQRKLMTWVFGCSAADLADAIMEDK